MRNKKLAAAVLSMTILFLCQRLNAETIYLKNGGIIRGKVMETTKNEVIIDIGGGTITQNTATIARIEEDYTKETVPISKKTIRAPKSRSSLAEIISDFTNTLGSILSGSAVKESE